MRMKIFGLNAVKDKAFFWHLQFSVPIIHNNHAQVVRMVSKISLAHRQDNGFRPKVLRRQMIEILEQVLESPHITGVGAAHLAQAFRSSLALRNPEVMLHSLRITQLGNREEQIEFTSL